MVRVVLIVVFFSSFQAFAQREVYIRPGLISTGLTISPSQMLNRAESNYYLSGFITGRLDKHLSFRGESHYFVDGALDVPYFKSGLRTHFGLQYHLSKGNFDAHIGFLPGLAVQEVNGEVFSPVHVTPSFSSNVGVTYYVWKFFNFFANVTYLHSTIHDVTGGNGRTDELMFSAGLGLNINTVKAR